MAPILLRILFIGNSLTAANNLPAMAEALAHADGAFRVETRAVVFPNHSLDDHWARGDARRAIRDERWDVVVLQQGPSALPESQRQLRASVKTFDREIRTAGARTALYMVWPSRSRSFDFDSVRTSYARAAADVGGILIPAGDAWRAAWRRDSTLRLYDADGFHPSGLGSYLAALTIYQKLTGRSPVGIPTPFSAYARSVVRQLQESAAEANGASTSGQQIKH